MNEAASAGGCDEEPVAASRGEGRDGAIGAPVVTAFMLDGRMLSAVSAGGEPGAGAAGGGICCDEVRRDSERTRGDAGTELRSGMVRRKPGNDFGLKVVRVFRQLSASRNVDRVVVHGILFYRHCLLFVEERLWRLPSQSLLTAAIRCSVHGREGKARE